MTMVDELDKLNELEELDELLVLLVPVVFCRGTYTPFTMSCIWFWRDWPEPPPPAPAEFGLLKGKPCPKGLGA